MRLSKGGALSEGVMASTQGSELECEGEFRASRVRKTVTAGAEVMGFYFM